MDTKKYPHKKKSVAAVIFGIVSLLYFFIIGQIILVLLAFGASFEALLYTFIFPAILSLAGMSISVYTITKGGAKPLSITGIVLNLIALCIIAAICILFYINV